MEMGISIRNAVGRIVETRNSPDPEARRRPGCDRGPSRWRSNLQTTVCNQRDTDSTEIDGRLPCSMAMEQSKRI